MLHDHFGKIQLETIRYKIGKGKDSVPDFKK